MAAALDPQKMRPCAHAAASVGQRCCARGGLRKASEHALLRLPPGPPRWLVGALKLRCLYLWPGARCMVERAGCPRILSPSAGGLDPARGKGVRVRGLGWGSKSGRSPLDATFSWRCCCDFGSREWATARLQRASLGRSMSLGPVPAACSQRRIVRSHSRVCLGKSSSLLVLLLRQPRRIARARRGPVGACDAVHGGTALQFYHTHLKHEFAGRPRYALGVRGARPGGDVIGRRTCGARRC